MTTKKTEKPCASKDDDGYSEETSQLDLNGLEFDKILWPPSKKTPNNPSRRSR